MEETTDLPNPEEPRKQVKSFKTAQGSVYTYDHDGKTTRFKAATSEKFDRQDVTVFIDLTPEEEQEFLRAYRHPTKEDEKLKVYVLERQPDNTPKIIRDVKEIKTPDQIYLGIIADGKVITTTKASVTPSVGYQPFDSRHYQENGEWFTQRHIGNKITEIEYQEN
jgi:hypothetical protein